MGHYTGPKARINRRLGGVIYENAGALRAFQRRSDSPPGMVYRRRSKQSEYGKALQEKQKIKHYYGLSEAQLRRFLAKAQRLRKNVGVELLKFCERRLDNVIRRAGLCVTHPQARQGVVHGHFLVNGRKATVPSIILKAGDLVQVRPRPALFALYTRAVDVLNLPGADWMTVDKAALAVRVTRHPDDEDVTLPVEVGRVVELMSR